MSTGGKLQDRQPRDELYYADVRTLSDLLRRREISATELTQAVLDRIDRLEGQVNAYITVTAEQALEDARRCDAALTAGQPLGPLHGIPLALKDLYDTAGIRTTAGSKILADRVPQQDATSVAKLRAAGAVLVGKTNLHEFAFGVTTENPHYGDTHNPWDLDHAAGGSSGGSGAAVAAGLCIVSTGSDTGGSIRIPAALCGVVGLKPSFGRISCHGLVPLSWELDHAGPIMRTVYDAALMLEVMAGWDLKDPRSVRAPVRDYTAGLDVGGQEGDLKGLHIAVDPDYALSGITPEVRAAFEKALEVLTALGAEIVEVSVPRIIEGQSKTLTIIRAEGAAYHAGWLSTRIEDYSPFVRSRLEAGLGVTGVDYAEAQHLRRQLVRDFEILFEDVDLFATPMCGMTAPALGQEQVEIDGQDVSVVAAITRFTRLFNLTGLPAISLPCGLGEDGLPIGLQLAGASFDETTLLRAAHAYEQATPWHRQRPPMI
jgi:aspartyl-tRNA(Asn)/glutamyl-tRNA(Gln) amidotransferase subunit A